MTQELQHIMKSAHSYDAESSKKNTRFLELSIEKDSNQNSSSLANSGSSEWLIKSQVSG